MPGTVSGLTGAGAIDPGQNFGYVCDPANGKVHTFALGNLISAKLELFRDEELTEPLDDWAETNDRIRSPRYLMGSKVFR
jgi:hypothetical protein